MEDILRGYDVNPATWFYLSLLLIVAVFFRFGRVWSVRNLDLILLLSLSPGLILVETIPAAGYAWLFTATALLLLRLFSDPLFTRRPRLEQNLNVPGMAFLAISAFAFLMTIALTDPPPQSTVDTVGRAERLLNRQDAGVGEAKSEAGPAPSLLAAPVKGFSDVVAAGNGSSQAEDGQTALIAARTVVIIAHALVVAGLISVGSRHFGDMQIGLAMATLYLLLPCTAFDVGKFNHVLPSALIVWAVAAYRRPMIAGGLMGLACGTLFFPVFLLPLWAGFYDRRGAVRFGLALGIVGAILLASLAMTSTSAHSFAMQTFGSIDWGMLSFQAEESGFWRMYDPAYRIPVFVAFVLMLVVLTIWPRKKNLEHLMANSTAIIVATQFWYPQQGGVYLLWYVPLMLMVVFRPRMAHLLPPDLRTNAAQATSRPHAVPREMAASGSAVDRHFFR